jgi:hypothetical protein
LIRIKAFSRSTCNMIYRIKLTSPGWFRANHYMMGSPSNRR